MDENKISLRYAKALFSLVSEKNVLEEVKNDIDLIFKTLKDIPELKTVLTSPVVSSSEKERLLKNSFAEVIHPITGSFFNLVLSNKRESYLEDIFRNFLDLYRDYKGLKSAMLSSAIELDGDIIENFKDLIRRKFKTEVDLSVNVNSDLIGGFVLRVEDQQIDASVSSKLKRLKQELVKSR